jgi:para-nitrobenzyl esterase
MKRGLALALFLIIAGGVFSISPLKDRVLETVFTKTDKVPVKSGKVRSTTSGNVEGVKAANGAISWLGIPYARPPLGQLRWRAPKAAFPWAGVKETTVAGPPCFQFGPSPLSPEVAVKGSEDCLYLNVQAPGGSTSADKMPVIFWIHGGDNLTGAVPDLGTNLLVPNYNVVVITPSFRLGGLGWFSHPSIQYSGEPTGNFGTLDLISALTWVKDNAESFGGDPNNIVLFGETSGTRNVVSLLFAPEARGLFHKVILTHPETGFDRMQDAEGFRGPEENSSDEVIARLLMSDGLVNSRTEAANYLTSVSPEDLARYLRAKSPHDFLKSYHRVIDTGPFAVSTVFRDGVLIDGTAGTYDLAKRMELMKIPFLIGSNRDAPRYEMMNDAAFVVVNKLKSPIPKDLLSYQKLSHYLGLGERHASVDTFARQLVSAGHESVFVFRFDWDEEPIVLGTDYGFLVGAGRRLEVPFLLGDFTTDQQLGYSEMSLFAEENRSSRETLSAAMMSYVAAFAHKGVPEKGMGGDLPDWQPFNSEEVGRKKLILDSSSDGGIRMSNREITASSIANEIRLDKALPTPEQKCAMVRYLNVQNQIWSEEQVGTLFDGACSA